MELRLLSLRIGIKKMKMLFTSLGRSVLSKSVPYVLRIMNIKY